MQLLPNFACRFIRGNPFVNTKLKRCYPWPVDRINTNVIFDHAGVSTIFYPSKDYPRGLRRFLVKDQMGKRLILLTKDFAREPTLIALLYQ